MSSLDKIGFYTLTDERAKGKHNNLERCEMIVTSNCNFKCPYCRGVQAYSRDCRGDIEYNIATDTLDNWIEQGLKNIRFSGGEPTLYPYIQSLVYQAKSGGISRIAISTNGSLSEQRYASLLRHGVNDFSISLDACCAEDADKMAGRSGYFKKVIDNIEWLSKETYVTVGIVLTKETESSVVEVVKFAHSLGVSDIRIITAAQYNGALSKIENIPAEILDAHPILKYRVNNLLSGKNVRGISDTDCSKCHLVKDDSVVAGRWHFPCVIHMREGGEPIGEVGPNMQAEREEWSANHNTHEDPICKSNCLDCLVEYNNTVELGGK
jgi:molybdenum cofactor biosynthesis enzyme MoaA